MKIKTLAPDKYHKVGTILSLDDVHANILIKKGYAVQVNDDGTTEAPVQQTQTPKKKNK
jgi:hypothetical protein